jgi:hypothetical protein
MPIGIMVSGMAPSEQLEFIRKWHKNAKLCKTFCGVIFICFHNKLVRFTLTNIFYLAYYHPNNGLTYSQILNLHESIFLSQTH